MCHNWSGKLPLLIKKHPIMHNRVGRETKVFWPTFVSFPLTPPYVPFGIRRFRTLHLLCRTFLFCTHPAKRHFFPIFGIRPIVLERELLFGHLTTKVTEHIASWRYPRTVRPFATYYSNMATSTSADFLTFVVTILKRTVKTSRDKPYIFHRLSA